MATANYDATNHAPNPNDHFVAGRIAAIEGRDLIIEDAAANDPLVPEVVTRVVITDTSRFWMGRVGAALTMVKPGHALFARGVLESTTLTARQAWVNIVSLGGIVTDSDNAGFVLSDGEKTWRIVVQPETEHLVGPQHQAQPPIEIARHTQLQVIGLWDEEAQLVRATRLFWPVSPDN